MYYVYIIYNRKINKFYIGYTSDLKRRILEHNGRYKGYTSIAGNWKLVYYEAFIMKEDAREEEVFLKSGKGRERRKYLLSNYLRKMERCLSG